MARISSLSEQGRAGPKYHPADTDGNFAFGNQDNSGSRRVDLEEPDSDPSERKPGGPLAEAIREANPSSYRQKWLLPLAVYGVALLVQCTGLYAATRRYVKWMIAIDAKLHATDQPHPHEMFRLIVPRDNFADWLDTRFSLQVAWVHMLAWALPFLWFPVVVFSRNLRLWTRTLLAASFLAALKGFFCWITLVPDSSGWESCQENLHPVVLNHFEEKHTGLVFSSALRSIMVVAGMWVQDVVLGMRLQKMTVCPNSLSGATWVSAVFALGLYDAARTQARKLKPMIRSLVHATSALVLSAVVVFDSLLLVRERQQYTVDVVVATALALLMYGSPMIAVGADYFMMWDLPEVVELREGCDGGDVLVPPCCMPFCFLHGRYFLFKRSAVEVAESKQANREAGTILKEFDQSMQESLKRVQDFQLQLENARRRSAETLRREEQESSRALTAELAELLWASEQRVAQTRARLETEVQANRQKTIQWEDQATMLAIRSADASERFARGQVKLQAQLRESSQAAAEARKAETKATALEEDTSVAAKGLRKEALLLCDESFLDSRLKCVGATQPPCAMPKLPPTVPDEYWNALYAYFAPAHVFAPVPGFATKPSLSHASRAASDAESWVACVDDKELELRSSNEQPPEDGAVSEPSASGSASALGLGAPSDARKSAEAVSLPQCPPEYWERLYAMFPPAGVALAPTSADLKKGRTEVLCPQCPPEYWTALYSQFPRADIENASATGFPEAAVSDAVWIEPVQNTRDGLISELRVEDPSPLPDTEK